MLSRKSEVLQVLRVVDIYKHFGGIKAVNGAEFSVKKGEIVALIGPNGAGKTTVFNCITGFIQIDKGRIFFEGEDITNKRPEKIASMGLARTFQIIRLFPKMTVLENMMIAMRDQYEGLHHVFFSRKKMMEKQKEAEEKAIELLEFVGLEAKEDELAMNLSYGQQKLLEIAKTIATDAEFLMFDEPAAGVNLTMLKKISGLLKKLKEQGKTILFVEHNMEFVMNMADKVVVLDHGDEIAIGTPKQIKGNKKVIDAYLGGVQC